MYIPTLKIKDFANTRQAFTAFSGKMMRNFGFIFKK